MIVISVVHNGQPQIELAAVRQLIELELEKCPSCNQVHKEHNAVPYHCHMCRTVRDDRWYFVIRQRAKSLWNVSLR